MSQNQKNNSMLLALATVFAFASYKFATVAFVSQAVVYAALIH